MQYFAAVSLNTKAPVNFAILHNETLKEGRYVPKMKKSDPNSLDTFEFVPAMTRRAEALNYGDNRLADLQYRTQAAI